jgi:hypothetical protein
VKTNPPSLSSSRQRRWALWTAGRSGGGPSFMMKGRRQRDSMVLLRLQRENLR